MANQIIIDIGATANDGTGDPLRTAFDYVNDNFSNVWNTGLPSSNVLFSGNRILTANTNGNLILSPNGIGKVVSNVDIRPNANNTLSLGSSDLRWNSVYAQNLDVGGNVSFNNVTVDSNLTVQGNIIQVGNIVTETLTIQLANAAVTANSANGSGITVGANDNIATLLYNSSSNVWTTNIGITASGNVAGTYFIGNGSQLTGLPATYSNTNATSLLASFGSNTISTTGNISAGYFVGNGSQLTGISTVSLGNLEVIGSAIKLANGSPNTSVYLTANGVSGNAYISIPSNPTTLADGLSIVNLHGRVEIKAKDGGAAQSWYFQEDGSLQLPGSVPAHITSDNDIVLETGSGDHWIFGVDGVLTTPGNIIPDTSNAYSLGNATNQWKDLWVSNATIYMNSVPVSLTAGNVLTVNGADVVTTSANGESNVGNLDISGTIVAVAAGAPETLINISPSGPTGGWAFLQLPTNDTANTADTRLWNGAGNVEIGTGDFSTGETDYIWTLGNDGTMSIPGMISSSNTIEINNRATSNTADIRLNSADDIFLQGRDKPDDLESEGGDIFVYGGDGANAATSGFDTGGGGDVQIEGGIGGAGEVSSTSGGGGGIITIRGGDGGTSLDSNAGGGGDINLTAGSAPGAATTALGGLGGGVNIIAGTTTRINESGGSIELSTGGASGDGTGAAGYVSINIPSSNVGTGGQWIFGGTGTTLNVPANAEIYGANFGNFTVGCAGNTIVTSSDYGANVQNWVFGYTGNLTLPQGGVVYETGIPFGGLEGKTIALKPYGGTDADQQLLVYPTAGTDFNHLHLTTGNLWNTEMFLGNDDFYVKLANTGNIVINTNDNGGNTYQLNFTPFGEMRTTGSLFIQTPNGVPNGVTAITGSSGSWESNPTTDLATTNGEGAGLTVTVTETGGYASAIAIVNPGSGYADGDVITVTSGSSSATFTISVANNQWILDTEGELTLPNLSLGSGLDEQTVIRSQRKLIPPLRWSAVISGTTPTVVYNATSVDTTSMKVTMQIQHQGLGMEFFEVFATFTGSDTYYTVSNRVAPPTIDASTVVVGLGEGNVMKITATINSGAGTSWVTYDAVEFGIPND